ncbi:MAG: hypothetical protein HRU41_22815 [Saprospiraceae bacterium]|nr:hypothetical protein [Saprospiraceae bacterium]
MRSIVITCVSVLFPICISANCSVYFSASASCDEVLREQANEPLLEPETYDQALVEKILQRLWGALGDGRRALPEIRIVDNNSIASYLAIGGRDYIEFDRKTLEICRGLGDNRNAAIAFILGHELTHLYRAHAGNGFLPPRKNYRRYEPEEQEADLYGSFFAELAGFQVEDSIEPLFEAIYTSFPKKVVKQYPSKTDRINTALERCRISNELQKVFKMGIILNVVGEYQAAILCFEYVNRTVRFQQNFLNLGATYLNLALLNRIKPMSALDYPIFLNQETPFRKLPSFDVPQEELLRKAEIFLRESQAYAPKDPATLINLIAVLDQQGLSSEVYTSLKILAQLPVVKVGKYSLAHRLLEGIIAYRENPESVEARDAFNEVFFNSETPASLKQIARNNIRIMDGKLKKIPSPPEVYFEDRMDGFFILSPKRPSPSIGLPFKNDNKQKFSVADLTHSELSHLQWEDGSFLLQVTNSPLFQTKRGLRIGRSMQEIQDKYPGTYKFGPEDPLGYWVFIPAHGLIFRLNTIDKIEECGIFWANK